MQSLYPIWNGLIHLWSSHSYVGASFFSFLHLHNSRRCPKEHFCIRRKCLGGRSPLLPTLKLTVKSKGMIMALLPRPLDSVGFHHQKCQMWLCGWFWQKMVSRKNPKIGPTKKCYIIIVSWHIMTYIHTYLITRHIVTYHGVSCTYNDISWVHQEIYPVSSIWPFFIFFYQFLLSRFIDKLLMLIT